MCPSSGTSMFVRWEPGVERRAISGCPFGTFGREGRSVVRMFALGKGDFRTFYFRTFERDSLLGWARICPTPGGKVGAKERKNVYERCIEEVGRAEGE
jgi:hypothetical protein